MNTYTIIIVYSYNYYLHDVLHDQYLKSYCTHQLPITYQFILNKTIQM